MLKNSKMNLLLQNNREYFVEIDYDQNDKKFRAKLLQFYSPSEQLDVDWYVIEKTFGETAASALWFLEVKLEERKEKNGK